MILNPWQGKHVEIARDRSSERDVEGARMSAKTTLCLDLELAAMFEYPGIHALWFRYSDTDTRSKLRPAVEELMFARGIEIPSFDRDQLCYDFPNRSKAFMFGLKAANQTARYAKMRGLSVARVYNDQSEELPEDIGLELRASLRQPEFPHQLTFSPNPISTTHWLAKKDHGGFPEDNSVKGRKYFHLSLYDNAYNLPPESIERMERTFPLGHAKHRMMILGLRGPNVIGDAVFEDSFDRRLHVRPLKLDRDSLVFEGFDFGKRNPVWIVAQRFYSGGLGFLGGVFGENLFLEDFLHVVAKYRVEWFDAVPPSQFRACCPSPGAGAAGAYRFGNYALLRQRGWSAIFPEQDANAPDVALALIERFVTYMRRRGSDGEQSFAINSDESRWLRVSREGVESTPFLAHTCEASAVWDAEWASVAHQKHSQVHEDDEASNILRAALNIELNFCATIPTDEELAERRRSQLRPYDREVANARSWMGM